MGAFDMLIERLCGILALAIAGWQFYSFRQAFRSFKKTAGKNTNVFIGFGLWLGLFFGIIIFLLGLALLFGAF